MPHKDPGARRANVKAWKAKNQPRLRHEKHVAACRKRGVVPLTLEEFGAAWAPRRNMIAVARARALTPPARSRYLTEAELRELDALDLGAKIRDAFGTPPGAA